MHENLEDRIRGLRERIESLVASYSFNKPKDLLRQSAQRVDELERSLTLAFAHLYRLSANRHQGMHQRLESLSPSRVLERGYTIVRKEGQVVMSSKKLEDGDRATLQFHDGDVPTRVEKKS